MEADWKKNVSDSFLRIVCAYKTRRYGLDSVLSTFHEACGSYCILKGSLSSLHEKRKRNTDIEILSICPSTWIIYEADKVWYRWAYSKSYRVIIILVHIGPT